LISSETWHITNENSLKGRKKEKCMNELENTAHYKQESLIEERSGRSACMSLEMYHVIEDSLERRKKEHIRDCKCGRS
jgi:hypothetical protein